jgi:Domain of unknown function (DUF1788)
MRPTHKRLNEAFERLCSESFLKGYGLGNELAFHIFDYPANDEQVVREQLEIIYKKLIGQKPDLTICHVSLFDTLVEYLKERKLLDPAIQMQKGKGNIALLQALQAPLREDRLLNFMKDRLPEKVDLILLSGIGACHPLLGSHRLLSNLQPLLGQTPMVLFLPGKYDSQVLQLFGTLPEENYYRAFRLVS